MTARIVVAPDHDTLAAAVAARLITALVDALSRHDEAHVCLTGGRIGTSSLAAVAASPACNAIDWSRVHVWWSDERFLPTGDPERNETGARDALLDHVAIPLDHVHPMPQPQAPWGDDVDQAAGAYAVELAAHASGESPAPTFDVLLLGVGPDGHVASLFPGLPQIDADGVTCAVVNSPKPPPVRISFTRAMINTSRQVWLIASGTEKAAAMAAALNTSVPSDLPAALVHGTELTLALLDRDAASELHS